MLAGEKFSDRPESVCPVIGIYLRTYNDLADEDQRQALYRYAAQVVGTRGRRRMARKRARLCRARALAVDPRQYLKLRMRVPLPHPELTAACAVRTILGSATDPQHEMLELLDELLNAAGPLEPVEELAASAQAEAVVSPRASS